MSSTEGKGRYATFWEINDMHCHLSSSTFYTVQFSSTFICRRYLSEIATFLGTPSLALQIEKRFLFYGGLLVPYTFSLSYVASVYLCLNFINMLCKISTSLLICSIQNSFQVHSGPNWKGNCRSIPTGVIGKISLLQGQIPLCKGLSNNTLQQVS